MKNRTDKILLAVFFLSLAAYVVMFYLYFSYEPADPSFFETWFMRRFLFWMILGFHAVPTFCLQLLLCRRTRRWIAVLLALAITGAVLFLTYGFFTATGWDNLGYALLLFWSIAPAAGCVLAWAVYGFRQLYKRGDIRG